jgi:hypothetical protein
MITYARDHSVADGLNYIATWNAAMLHEQGPDRSDDGQHGQEAPTFKD